MNHFETLLREKQLKATLQRIVILKEIEKEGHMDVEELHNNIKESFPTMALGTLYRNLNDLVEKGILSEIQVPKQKQKYEICKTPHAHLVCEKCDSIMDVDADMDMLSESVKNKGVFRITGASVVLSGVCPTCQGK